MWWASSLVIYFFIASLLVVRLLINGIRPTKTLGWLLVIFTIPVGGIVFYLMLGRNRRKNKMISLQKSPEIAVLHRKISEANEATAVHAIGNDFEMITHQKLIRLISKNSNFQLSTGNKLKLLKNGPATFDAIFNAISCATQFIHLQYYIFEEGILSNRLLALFRHKIKEGVQIRIIYDAIGSNSLKRKYIKKLQEAGIEVYPFLPMRFGKMLSNINYRNHRKIIIVDMLFAFTGGINISDKYIQGDPNLGIWHDTHLQLEGPVVTSFQAIFAMDWYAVSSRDELFVSHYFLESKVKGESNVQIVSSGPDAAFAALEQLYFSMINEAKDYVYITNPYIIPGEAILKALQVAAMSGVDVRLLLSANSDSKLVKWCVRSYFESLLEAGVKVFLFPDGFLHSKVIVADDTVSTIGTANMDIRSFDQNYEVNVVIYDDPFAIALKDDFLKSCDQSEQLHYDRFIKRPWSDKLREGVAKIFSPVL